MTTRARRTNTDRRISAPTLLVDYSKQRANTVSTAILSSKSLHCSRTPLPSLVVPNPPSDTRPAAPELQPVLSSSKPRPAITSYPTPTAPRNDDIPCLSVYQRKPALKPVSQTMHTIGSRQWEIDEALLDISVKILEDDSESESESEGESESDSVSFGSGGTAISEATKSNSSSTVSNALLDASRGTIGASESSDHDSSSESSNSSSDDSDTDSSSDDDVPDDISELSDDESISNFGCSVEDKDARDIKGESKMMMSVASDTLTASLTESNHENRSLENVSFCLRRRKSTNGVSNLEKEAIPSAIRLQHSITRLLDDGSNETSASQDAELAPEVNLDKTCHKRRPSASSLSYLPVGPQVVVSSRSVLRRSNSCTGTGLIPAAPKNLAPIRGPSKRNLLTPLINVMAVPSHDATPAKHAVNERKVMRRSLARSSSESNLITLKPDGTVQRKGMGKTPSCTSLGTLMNETSARMLIVKSLKASDAHGRSTSVQSLARSNSQRSVTGLDSGGLSGGLVMMGNSGRRLMSNNSERNLMSNTSGRNVTDNNSGRILMDNSSGGRLAKSNSGRNLNDTRNHERRAKRRTQRSSTCDTNEAQCRLMGNRSASSLGSQMKPMQHASDTSADVNVKQGIAASRSSSSLGALMKMEDASERNMLSKSNHRTHNRMKKSSSASSLGRLICMGDASERSTVSRRRLGRRNSMESVGSNESAASTIGTIGASTARNRRRRGSLNGSLTSLRDTLAKDNPMPAESGSSLFVTGSRIRRRCGAPQ